MRPFAGVTFLSIAWINDGFKVTENRIFRIFLGIFGLPAFFRVPMSQIYTHFFHKKK